MAETVNHPPHYNAHPTGVEAIDICEHFNYNVGNAIKYLWRAGLKGDVIEDLRKAEWFVHREIERREKEAVKSIRKSTDVPSLELPPEIQHIRSMDVKEVSLEDLMGKF